jgi:hypothetical protein
VKGFDGIGNSSHLFWYCEPNSWEVKDGDREGKIGKKNQKGCSHSTFYTYAYI